MRQSRAGRPLVPMILPAILLVPLLSSGDPGSVSAAGATRPAGQHHVVHGWPELPPGEILGEATGVGIDSNGNVLVFHRAGRVWMEPFPTEPIARPTVWVFDGRTGRFLRSWGAGVFMMPHGLTVDHDDNVWLTDVGLRQVFKFSVDGRLLLKLGEAGTHGQMLATSTVPPTSRS